MALAPLSPGFRSSRPVLAGTSCRVCEPAGLRERPQPSSDVLPSFSWGRGTPACRPGRGLCAKGRPVPPGGWRILHRPGGCRRGDGAFCTSRRRGRWCKMHHPGGKRGGGPWSEMQGEDRDGGPGPGCRAQTAAWARGRDAGRKPGRRGVDWAAGRRSGWQGWGLGRRPWVDIPSFQRTAKDCS